MYINKFFETFSYYIQFDSLESTLDFIANSESLKRTFFQLDPKLAKKYLYNHFIFWLSSYACEKRLILSSFLSGKDNLDYICVDFIRFCFSKKIVISSEEILKSFSYHNSLLDVQVKKELKQIPRKETINLLAFGLDEGTYEKELTQFLIDNDLCKNAVIYGIDPYARRGNNIHYLTLQELNSQTEVNFDVFIARWSLHHVALTFRWHDLIQCINRCNSNATILFIEHGVLHERKPLIKENFYTLLNAIFDIIANIGLRPSYFTETEPKGDHFFIRYLKSEDYISIIDGVSKNILSQKIYDIGPCFPNQTIYKFSIE